MHKTFTAAGIILTSIGVLLIVGNFVLPHPPAQQQQPNPNTAANPMAGLMNLGNSLFGGGSSGSQSTYVGDNSPATGTMGPASQPVNPQQAQMLMALAGI
jgi:hypothetical protein